MFAVLGYNAQAFRDFEADQGIATAVTLSPFERRAGGRRQEMPQGVNPQARFLVLERIGKSFETQDDVLHGGFVDKDEALKSASRRLATFPVRQALVHPRISPQSWCWQVPTAPNLVGQFEIGMESLPAPADPATQFGAEFLKFEVFTRHTVLRVKSREVVVKRPQPGVHGVGLETPLTGVGCHVQVGETVELEGVVVQGNQAAQEPASDFEDYIA